MKEIAATVQSIVQNVEKVILGKTESIKLILCAWFAGGHVLMEDVPGTGKTMMARALARSVDVDFKRVQFTPDLLPSDIVGTSIYRAQHSDFHFQPGPAFTSILLADEVNRATPRSQSALLEAMAESQVTVDGHTRPLDSLFLVLATQNPIEHQGTFPLPEAQLDRFMLKIGLGYPGRENEIQLVKNQNQVHPIQEIGAVANRTQIEQIRDQLHRVTVSDEVYGYAADLVEKTRETLEIKLGASPRAMLALIRAAQAMALIEGRSYVRPTQIYQLAKPVLAHRIHLTAEARLKGMTADPLLTRLIAEVKVPLGSS